MTGIGIAIMSPSTAMAAPPQTKMTAVISDPKTVTVTSPQGLFVASKVLSINNGKEPFEYGWAYVLYHDEGLDISPGTEKSDGVVIRYTNIQPGDSKRVGLQLGISDFSDPPRSCFATVQGKTTTVAVLTVKRN